MDTGELLGIADEMLVRGKGLVTSRWTGIPSRG